MNSVDGSYNPPHMQAPTPISTEGIGSPIQGPKTISVDAEARNTKLYIDEIKRPLGELTVSIYGLLVNLSFAELTGAFSFDKAAVDALQGQTMQIALLGEPGTKKEISEFVDLFQHSEGPSILMNAASETKCAIKTGSIRKASLRYRVWL